VKYRSRTLDDMAAEFPIKVIIEYRPDGVLADYAPMVYAKDPEAAADEPVRERGWDQRPGFRPTDVWVDGAM
jgi:hypothetical protein